MASGFHIHTFELQKGSLRKHPKYNPLQTNEYLDNLESYLTTQNFQQTEWIKVLPLILPKNTLSWLMYQQRKHGSIDWLYFRDLFVKQFDNFEVRHRRLTHLINRKQLDNEKVDSYIWDIVRLSQQVFPNEEEEDIVRRCILGLLPRLRLAVLNINKYSIGNLIEKCTDVSLAMEEVDKIQSNSNQRFSQEISIPKTNIEFRGRQNGFRGYSRFNGYNHNLNRNYLPQEHISQNPRPREFQQSSRDRRGYNKYARRKTYIEGQVHRANRNRTFYRDPCKTCGFYNHTTQECYRDRRNLARIVETAPIASSLPALPEKINIDNLNA